MLGLGFAAFFAERFEIHQSSKFELFIIDLFQGWLFLPKPLKAFSVFVIEVLLVLSKRFEECSTILDIGLYLSAEPQKMVLHQTHDVESIGNNKSVGKPKSNELSVGRTQVNTDHLNFVSSSKRAQKAGQIGLALALGDIEDFGAFEIAEGRHEALTSMQGVFINAQYPRAGLILALLG